ncbi:MAG TPA: HEAT repeat domain-containing protein [Thermoanaerobaculia bacterium]|nr:HEAT repeat domain-containing protein [Thermoanaerobaculia bacterium]
MLTRLGRTLALTLVFAALSLPALASKKTEEELIALLNSPDEGKVTGALQDLEKGYPESKTAQAAVVSKLKDPREKVQRKAARVLGAIHAPVDKKILADITPLLKSPNKDAVIDGLKALRGLDSKSTIPEILPLLKSPDENIKRDSCRTLAEIGDASLVPKIEPLLNDPNKKVQIDANDAIAKLKSRAK